MGALLDRLKEKRVFEVSKVKGKHAFQIEELCDYYYSDELSADEVRLLGEELIAMSATVLNSD